MAATSPLLKGFQISRSLRARSLTTFPALSDAACVFGVDVNPQGAVRSPDIQHKLTAEGYHLLIDMPGLSKKDVKLMVKENVLIVKGEGKTEYGFGDKDVIDRNYGHEFVLPPKICKIEEIKAEMKNGVLKAFLPMIKDEERSDVFKVRIE